MSREGSSPPDRPFHGSSAGACTAGQRGSEGGPPPNLPFWVEAFKHEKVDLGRYRLQAEEEFHTDAGRDGRLLDLRLGQGAAEYAWLVALFVDPSRIVTVEAGGPTIQIALDRNKLLAAMRTLRY